MDTFANTEGLYFGTARVVFPLLVGMGLFAVITLEPGISSLSGIGREGKNMWILKTAPFRGRLVAQAKILSNVAQSPMIVLGTALFSAYYLGYHTNIKVVNYTFLEIVAFSVMGALTMVFLFTGLGTWFGTKYPNLDESNKGYPDIMTMYLFAMCCLILGFLFLAGPFYLMMRGYNTLGLLSLLFMTDIAALFLYITAEEAGRAFEKLEYG
jgi:hypothetical protein